MHKRRTILKGTLVSALFFGIIACSGGSNSSSEPEGSSSTTPLSSEGSGEEDEPLQDIVCPEGTDSVVVAANDPAIAYDGVWFPQTNADSALLYRHSPECLLDGNCVPGWTKQYGYDRCHAGVVIRFRTNAPQLRMVFAEDPTVAEANRRYPYLKVGVYIDGEFNSSRGPLARVTQGRSYTFIPTDPEQIRTYEIVLPHQLATIFYGVLLPEGGCLQPVAPLKKPVYVAVGNSLTHGEGQNSSYEGFAWKVARAKGWELINLAIGGTTISPAIITKNFSSDKRVDVVSVEWGYNDWTSASYPISTQTEQFEAALDAIRTTHPDARIYVITPFTTTTTDYGCIKDGICTADSTTIGDWRKMMRQVVEKKGNEGDQNIFVIHGDKISTADDLTTDGVHLSTAGAERVADSLIAKMSLE